MRHTVYSRAVKRAAELLGGPEALAKHLGATHTHVLLWMSAQAVPPQHVFLKVVDLLSDSHLEELRNNGKTG